MCFNSSPQPPQIVYQGPSEEEIARQNTAMETYRQQAADQQKLLADQLQQQIDTANTRMAEQQTRLAEEQAMSARALTQQGAYAVQTMQETPTAVQTTSAVKAKEKPRASLKIAPGSTPTSAGTGLNIGV